MRAVIAASPRASGVEAVSVSAEDEYFPPPPQLRAFLGALQAAVEAGWPPATRAAGPLDEDRAWGATEALAMLGT